MKSAMFRHFDAAEFEQGRHEIDIRGQGVHVASVAEAAVGIADEEGDAMAALVGRPLLAAHSGVIAARTFLRELVGVEFDAVGSAVVGHKDQDGIIPQAQFV